jgi:hypothetical protein
MNKQISNITDSLATENINLKNRLELLERENTIMTRRLEDFEKEISKVSEIEKIVKELQQKRLEIN